jgi:hypothetical protein
MQLAKLPGWLFGVSSYPLKFKDQIKMSFITSFIAFCYTIMPFGLKSAGATYQRDIQRYLHHQLGQNIEAYVEDVVVKTRESKGLIFDLAETFNSMRQFSMKLNLEKCMFGVPSGKLLRYMVSHRRIHLNPEKILAIMNMKPPKSLHDVQKLTGA